jgi:hypothetical protein
MTQRARERRYTSKPVNYSDCTFDGLERELEFLDDPLLEMAYVISALVITFVGPLFWICLAYLFLVAEFRN